MFPRLQASQAHAPRWDIYTECKASQHISNECCQSRTLFAVFGNIRTDWAICVSLGAGAHLEVQWRLLSHHAGAFTQNIAGVQVMVELQRAEIQMHHREICIYRFGLGAEANRDVGLWISRLVHKGL